MAMDALLSFRFWLTRNVIPYRGLHFDTNTPRFTSRARRFLFRGGYEAPEAALSSKHLDPHGFVMEFGAGIGVISCQINRLLTDPSRHLCVEADPSILALLRRNREINKAGFRVVEGAVGYDPSGKILLGGGEEDFCRGRAISAEHGAVGTVPAWTLAQLLEFVPSSEPVQLVMDIEGMEYELILREMNLLASRVSMIIMETHPHSLDSELLERANRLMAEGPFEHIDTIRDVQAWRNLAIPQGGPA